MKTAKKLSSLLLAMIMLVALAVVPAAADDDTDTTGTSTTSITVIPQDNGTHSYSAYPIFKGTLSASGVLSSVEWADGVNGDAILNALKTSNDTNFQDAGVNIFADCKTAASVAEAIANFGNDTEKAKTLASFFETNKDNLGTAIPLNGKSKEGYPSATVPAGYYLVLETTENATEANKTRAILNVANDEYIASKVEGVATVTKEADGISYGIGDEIPYTVTVSLKDYKADADKYEFTLTDDFGTNLEPAFTTVANPSAIADGLTITLDTANGTDITKYFHLSYNLTTHIMTVVAYNPKDGSNNLVGIDGLTLSSDSKIVLQYKAKLVNAYDGSGEAVNKVQYNTSVTVPEYVYPINLTVKKVNGADPTELLKGAKFKLTDKDGNYAQINTTTNNVTSWTANEDEASVLTATEGTFTVKGLKAGTYYLKEIAAPDTYNLPENPFELVIDAKENDNGNGLETLTISVDNGTTENGDTATNTVTATIANNKGATLPSTGGMGTTIFYVVGAILAVGAIVLLVTRKRMNDEK